MTGQLICRVKPSSTWILVGLFLAGSVGMASAPHWSDTSFYPWERLDIRWLIGTTAFAIMMAWLIPRYLLRLRASKGWGVWVEDGSLFLVSRAKPMPLSEIERIWIREKPFPYVMVEMEDGKSVAIAAWAMKIDAPDLAARIVEARQAEAIRASGVS